MCLSVSVETKHRLLVFYLFSDELRGVSFADEDFQQPQLGFDVLVFVVLGRQRGAVLLLHVSTATRQQTWMKKGMEAQQWNSRDVNVCSPEQTVGLTFRSV